MNNTISDHANGSSVKILNVVDGFAYQCGCLQHLLTGNAVAVTNDFRSSSKHYQRFGQLVGHEHASGRGRVNHYQCGLHAIP